ncbi:MAG: hypothetical protein NC331_03645 [Lachnospiraceae bacterium]|nr:hypothetical protein [Lachnospiraceae bacterium]MCM1215669.1 hypothetical protein [Lachnospiraceae bacterium]MCM1238462.1 hypothetical protein [Lachnospiraceae bacterium]
MHFQFLIEDQSGAALIEILMQKISLTNRTITYNCKSFKGLGGFTKKNTVKETKSGKLLNDLATYLRGFNKSFQYIPAVIIVVLDNDTRNTEEFLTELNRVAQQNMITVDYVFCIAVEEMEAWLLGDEVAVLTAYPLAKIQLLHTYVQDSICGTWEVLADVIYPGGASKMKKECPTYTEIGNCKSEWAQKIGCHMDIANNNSPSFNHFIAEITKRLSIVL